jgi:hypothetical protein
MSSPPVTLAGFAFGEYLEGAAQRSLGFRLLAPTEAEPWTAEVEALARRLQAAPYPDSWPPADLFCSVLLADGQRLIAVARYGLTDHTPSRRRGGLELLGVVGPGNLGVSSALAVYRWLRRQRSESHDLRTFGGRHPLAEIISSAAALPAAPESRPALPIRLWHEGTLLFAATTPTDPDDRLVLLEQGAGSDWQWLPLVGADFPLETYAGRGPLIAWSPPVGGVALKHGHRSAARADRRRQILQAVLGTVLALLLAANLWATLAAPKPPPAAKSEEVAHEPAPKTVAPSAPRPEEISREQFARALYHLLKKEHATQGWTENQLIDRYQQAVSEDPRLRATDAEAKAAVGAVSVLARHSPSRIEADVREALTGRGYDPELVNLACKRVHEQLTAKGRTTGLTPPP